jgi:hypothetical protein
MNSLENLWNSEYFVRGSTVDLVVYLHSTFLHNPWLLGILKLVYMLLFILGNLSTCFDHQFLKLHPRRDFLIKVQIRWADKLCHRTSDTLRTYLSAWPYIFEVWKKSQKNSSPFFDFKKTCPSCLKNLKILQKTHQKF